MINVAKGSLADLRGTLSGIHKLASQFERADTYEGRVDVMGVALVCLLNAEAERVKEKIALLEAAERMTIDG